MGCAVRNLFLNGIHALISSVLVVHFPHSLKIGGEKFGNGESLNILS